jgi:hypothetical protein
LEFELGAGFEGACGFALVLALSQVRKICSHLQQFSKIISPPNRSLPAAQ